MWAGCVGRKYQKSARVSGCRHAAQTVTAECLLSFACPVARRSTRASTRSIAATRGSRVRAALSSRFVATLVRENERRLMFGRRVEKADNV